MSVHNETPSHGIARGPSKIRPGWSSTRGDLGQRVRRPFDEAHQTPRVAAEFTGIHRLEALQSTTIIHADKWNNVPVKYSEISESASSWTRLLHLLLMIRDGAQVLHWQNMSATETDLLTQYPVFSVRNNEIVFFVFFIFLLFFSFFSFGICSCCFHESL